MFLIYYLLVTSLVGSSFSQLFPFSNIRHYFEHNNAENSGSSINRGKNIERPYRHLEDEKVATRVPEKEIIIAKHIENNEDEKPTTIPAPQHVEEDIIVVTPRQRYKPNNFVPEPSLDPNSDNIPSIGYSPNPRPKKRRRKIKPVEKKNTVETLIISQAVPIKGLGSKKHTENKFILSQPSETTIVESVPSLSITIPQTGFKNQGLVDYLVPPKNIPSIYNSDTLKDEKNDINREIVNMKPPRLYTKVKKVSQKTKSPPPQNSDNVRDSSTEKRVRLRVRRPVASKRNYQNNRTLQTVVYKGHADQLRKVDVNTYKDAAKYIDEQITSETGFTSSQNPSSLAEGERIEFQMHGQNGPHSYKFGYDTGKGKNRQFRYEEKDHDGNIKGHYGFYDKAGKLQIVNYHANQKGFYAQQA